MNIDEAKRIMVAAERYAEERIQRGLTPATSTTAATVVISDLETRLAAAEASAYAAELAAKTARLDAAEAREWAEHHVDKANARAAAAEAGQRAYGEVLLALANNGPRPADPGWGPLARALYAASVGGGAGETSDDAIARAMDAADDELAKERP